MTAAGEEPIRVLHVDDHADYVELPAARLERERERLSVVIAETVADALERLEREPVDCIVTEFRFRDGADGAALHEAVRERYLDLPIVFFTGAAVSDLSSLLEPGRTAIVPKRLDGNGSRRSDGVASPRREEATTYELLANRIESLVAHRRQRSGGFAFDALAGDVTEGLDVPICLLVDDEVAHANSAFEARYGHSPAGDGVADLASLAIEDADGLASFLATPGESRHVTVLEDADGAPRDVEVAAAGTERDGHRVVFALWLDPAEAVGEPSTEETMLESLLESIPLSVYFKDEQSRHVRVSKHLPRMSAGPTIDSPDGKVHHTAEDVQGKTDFDLYPTEHATSTVDDDRQVMATEQPIVSKEEHTVSPDGEDIYLSTSKGPWYDADGSVRGVVGVTVDITDQKRQHATVSRQNRRLQEFEDVIAQTVSERLTELRQHLERAREAGQTASLTAAERTVDVLEDVVADTLQLARYSQAPDDIEPVDLPDVVGDAWESVDAPSATLSVETDAVVFAAEPRLKGLLQQLFENALEHGSRAPDSPVRQEDAEHGDESVTVRVGDLAEGFYVEDDGPGVAPEERERVLDHGYTTAEDGTGIGLTVVLGIAQAHGWDVTVTESTAGGFRMEFAGVKRA
ncbi:MAG: PAS domain-containing protein [Haloarculaceae archaeon]